MVAAGLSACAFVVVTTGVDMGATKGGVDSGDVFTRRGVGLLGVSATGVAVDTWMVGPCVDTLSNVGVVGGAGL